VRVTSLSAMWLAPEVRNSSLPRQRTSAGQSPVSEVDAHDEDTENPAGSDGNDVKCCCGAAKDPIGHTSHDPLDWSGLLMGCAISVSVFYFIKKKKKN
jgi:hypothetical protein